MEREQKIQLLLDMQEHPEQFSEQALITMLDDPEVRELMEATAQLKQAMINDEYNANDVDAEWQRFSETHLTEKGESRRTTECLVEGTKAEHSWLKILCGVKRLSRAAATVIGILMISGIAFAAIHLWSLSPSPKGEISEYNNVSDTTRQSSPLPLDGSGEVAPVRYEEATLEQILTDMSDYYRLTLNWKSEEAKMLRLFYIWNKQQSAEEVITSMNSFERISLELNDSILTADIQTNSPKQ